VPLHISGIAANQALEPNVVDCAWHV